MSIEFLRQRARGVIGYQSALYRAAAKSLDFVSIVQREGLTTYAALNRARAAQDGGASLRMSFKNLRHPILIRPGTQDADTVINNIVREEYGQFTPPRDPLWMIDAGAYIGDTTAYFLCRFDKLRVIALEPNPESFPTAVANLAPYGERAILLPKGLWSRDERLSLGGGWHRRLPDRRRGQYRLRFRPDDLGTVSDPSPRCAEDGHRGRRGSDFCRRARGMAGASRPDLDRDPQRTRPTIDY